ncbi:MAG: SDR family NAD(P)-dependent oxidoreductase [Actinomycetota bacterium]|jgi:NAD(P)-dependent dehydrogenase (short-subunit alcohol dehydrogenase family)
MDDLRGKVAVITGGASGIGRALAERFAAEGMKIVIADIDEVAMRAVEVQLAEGGTEVLTQVCDTSLEAEVQALADAAMSRFGGAHVLCNNAGVIGKGDAWRSPIAVWDWVIGINLYGVIHGVRAFLPIMEDQGEGHIVNTASMAGLVALPGAAPYNVTKTGVVALSEGLYLELKATGSPVRVSALCPGFVKTNLAKGQKWTERLGSEPGAAQTPMAQMMDAVLAQGVEEGIEATDVADQVVDAIRTERFWILTHPEMRQAPVERMQRAADQVNPG